MGSELSSEGNFTEEIIASDKELLICHLCLTGFGDHRSYNNHRGKYHKDSTDGVVCVQFQDFISWKKLVFDNGTEKNVYKCLKCCQDFTDSRRLFKHLIVTADAKISCSTVESGGRKFRRPLAIRRVFSSSTSKAKTYTCCHCGKNLSSLQSLNNHKFTQHSTDKPEVHICETCSKSFGRRSLLTMHRRVHAPSKRLCGTCGLDFNTNDGLKRHQITHHSKDFKGFPCKICGKIFSCTSSRTKHMKLLHGNAEPKFSCSQCPKVFLKANNLTVHERIHSGQKPYQCHCGVGFAQKNSLNVHMRTHGLEIQKKRRDYSVGLESQNI